MKVCIDPGHGKANRTWGVYDPGAISPSRNTEEATVALVYGLTLQSAFHAKNIPTFMTRVSVLDPAPLGLRVHRALVAECSHLVSIHCNSAVGALAHGTEVLYRAPQDKALAEKLAQAVGYALGLHVRGAVLRDDLAILKFGSGPAVLIELGFLSNEGDRLAIIDPTKQQKVCEAIVATVTEERKR